MGFAISPHRHCHHQFVTALCAQVLSLPIFLVLSHPPLRCCMRVLFGSQLSPDILVPLTLPATERICCHLCIPAIIFWRPPNERQSVWKLRKIYLWCYQRHISGRQVGAPCVLFIQHTFSHIFEVYCIQGYNIIESASPLDLSKHVF